MEWSDASGLWVFRCVGVLGVEGIHGFYYSKIDVENCVEEESSRFIGWARGDGVRD